MRIEELKTAFKQGTLTKPDYIVQSYDNFHRTLFDYSANLSETDIREISIDAEGVVFTVRSSGIRIRCQKGDHRSPPFETFNFADFEPSESRMMLKLFEGRQTFYDIGANIGWHSLNLSARYRNADYYCFEPIPETYQQLLENIRLNKFSNIHTYNLALSDRQGQQTFYFYQACSGNASAVNLTGRDDVSAIECRLERLDEFMEKSGLPAPEFIKCDVEGAELMVFKGASKTLSEHKPIIMTEILRKFSAKYGYNPNEIFENLAGIGYRAFTTDGRCLIPFKKMNEETIETNFFFLHETSHGKEISRYQQPNP